VTTTTPAPQIQNQDVQGFPAMMQMITGYWVSMSIYVVAKLKIADRLQAEQPTPVSDLAKQAGANEDFLYRLMRALAGVGIFKESDGKCFTQTPLSQLLRSDVRGSMHGIAVMMGEEHYQAWGHLLESVRTGNRPFEMVYGMPVFEYFEKNPQAGEIFNSAMTGFASAIHGAIVATYDFSAFKTLVDVGGGHGMLLSTILEKNPALRGVLFDLPHVVQGACIPEALKNRAEIVGGDFFQSVYAGADAYILSTVIHDWADDQAISILKHIHAAMPAQATLLLSENVVEPDNQPSPAKFLDINMLVMTEGGRERSGEEFRVLLQKAGFELKRIIPTPSGICVLEGIKR
jgi:hypothetical protein